MNWSSNTATATYTQLVRLAYNQYNRSWRVSMFVSSGEKELKYKENNRAEEEGINGE